MPQQETSPQSEPGAGLHALTEVERAWAERLAYAWRDEAVQSILRAWADETVRSLVATNWAIVAEAIGKAIESSPSFAEVASRKAAPLAAEHVRQQESPNREVAIGRAIEVIGDEQEALRWLGMPVRALNYSTPISRLNSMEGQADVLAVLDNLEHGVL